MTDINIIRKHTAQILLRWCDQRAANFLSFSRFPEQFNNRAKWCNLPESWLLKTQSQSYQVRRKTGFVGWYGVKIWVFRFITKKLSGLVKDWANFLRLFTRGISRRRICNDILFSYFHNQGRSGVILNEDCKIWREGFIVYEVRCDSGCFHYIADHWWELHLFRITTLLMRTDALTHSRYRWIVKAAASYQPSQSRETMAETTKIL